jgi:hypothetical protein
MDGTQLFATVVVLAVSPSAASTLLCDKVNSPEKSAKRLTLVKAALIWRCHAYISQTITPSYVLHCRFILRLTRDLATWRQAEQRFAFYLQGVKGGSCGFI